MKYRYKQKEDKKVITRFVFNFIYKLIFKDK